MEVSRTCERRLLLRDEPRLVELVPVKILAVEALALVVRDDVWLLLSSDAEIELEAVKRRQDAKALRMNREWPESKKTEDLVLFLGASLDDDDVTVLMPTNSGRRDANNLKHMSWNR